MKILLLNLPVHTPTVMPYSLTMMKSVLKASINEDISALDLNAKYHHHFFNDLYKRLEEKEDYFSLLNEFMKKTRNHYPQISKSAITGEKPEGHDFLMNKILESDRKSVV